MIDLILIQDRISGIGLVKYKGKGVYLDPSHEELFQGFLTAFQNIISELKLGKLKQISTEDHHFIIHYEDPLQNGQEINIIMMFDCEDCVEIIQNKAKEIGCEFRNMFGNDVIDIDTSKYDVFQTNLVHILDMDKNVCLEMA